MKNIAIIKNGEPHALALTCLRSPRMYAVPLFIYHGGEPMETSEKFLIILMLFVCALMLFATGANAGEIPQDRAVKAIIGEAENQGYTGMLAVACAIRNRGTLKGVFGEKSRRVVEKKYSQKIYDQAVKAWKESANCDITNGANYWENTTAFGVPCWAKNMKQVYQHKDHTFWVGKKVSNG